MLEKDKLMNLADGKVLYDDLRNRIKEIDIPEVPVQDVQVNGTSVVSDGVANVPVMSTDGYGVAKINLDYGISTLNGYLRTRAAGDTPIKQGTNTYAPITPGYQHSSAFYGLAKAAGDSTQSASSNPVGTYTDGAKTAIKQMLGVTDPQVTDVQINGTSVVTNGVANVPLGGPSTPGVLMASGNGIGITNGYIQISPATSAQIKAGTGLNAPICVSRQNEAIYYGLSKLAGVNLASETVTVGAYPETSKAAIKSMLGVVDGSTGTVDVTGTTPSITAVENTRYVCGEVATLNFTPSSSGICIVRFTSGSTPTVLTVPNTVVFPEWFDATDLEASRVYEICITDGIYGAVMSWAL